MVARLGSFLTELSKRYMPDPLIFALALTFAAVLLSVACTGKSLAETLSAWRGEPGWDRGFWQFLGFSMQMCLVLVTGYALAISKPIAGLLSWIGSRPRSTGGAAAMISIITMIAALMNWGFGLIVGAVLAKEVARSAKARGLKFHYPLLGAAGYTALLVWHGGLSGSAPLKVAENGIDITRTLLSPLNLAVEAALLVAVPVILYLMAPKDDGEVLEITDEQAAAPKPAGSPAEKTFASALENSVLITFAVCAMAGWVLFEGFRQKGFRFVDLFSVPFLFLFLGMLFHLRPIRYVQAVSEAARACGGIILQFPFYAGIAGIMAGTGLGDVISRWIVQSASPVTYPLLAFLSAAVVNFFIPSGGGQWAVQGPVMLKAGEALAADPGKVVMYVAHGGSVTDMMQPFWTLALLGVTGLQARQIMGYTTALMLLTLPIFLFVVALL